MYLFPKIQSAVSGGGQQGTNIFGSGGQQVQGAQQPSSQQVQHGGAVNKTSLEGGTLGGNSGQALQKAQAATPAAQSTAILTRNKASGGQGFSNQIGDSIKKADQGLQDAANAYKGQVEGQNVGVSPDRVKEAVEKGGEAQGEVSTRLKTPAEAQKVPEYNPDINLNTGADDLRTGAGIEKQLRQRSDSRYSGGEAQLDAALLGRDAEFQKQRESLIDSQNALQQRADKQAESLTKYGKDRTTERYNAETEAIKKALQGKLADLDSAQAAQLAPLKETADKARSVDINYDYLNPQIAAAKAGLGDWFSTGGYKGQYENSPLSMSLDDVSGLVNPLEFYARHNPDVPTQEQMIDQGEADQYNRIYDMLGMSNMVQAGKYGPVTGDDQFDAEGYKQRLQDLASQQFNMNVAEGMAKAPPPPTAVPTAPMDPNDLAGAMNVPAEVGAAAAERDPRLTNSGLSIPTAGGFDMASAGQAPAGIQAGSGSGGEYPNIMQMIDPHGLRNLFGG